MYKELLRVLLILKDILSDTLRLLYVNYLCG